ncbi:MAG: DUF2062 domain-containing protein [Limisphaerales bacterium]
MPQTTQPSRLKKFWQQRVMALITAQLTQGFTPQKIALTIALGLNLGIFPILGATTLLCTIAGLWLKLNQPVIQFVNWLAAPLQLAMILVFVRIGEWIVRARHVSFSIPELFRKFHESPVKFMQEFGMTGLHGIIAWLVIAPFLTALIYFILLPPLKKLAAIKK